MTQPHLPELLSAYSDGNSGEFFLHTFSEQISYKNISKFSISGRHYKLEFSTLPLYSTLQRIFHH